MKCFNNEFYSAAAFDDTQSGVVLKEIGRCIRLWPKLLLLLMLGSLLLYPKEDLLRIYEQTWIGTDLIFITMIGFLTGAIEEFLRNRNSDNRHKFRYRFIGNLTGTAISAIIFCCCAGLIARFDSYSLLTLIPFGVILIFLAIVSAFCRRKWEEGWVVKQEPLELTKIRLQYCGAEFEIFYCSAGDSSELYLCAIPDNGFCCTLSSPTSTMRNIEKLGRAGLGLELAQRIANAITEKCGGEL